MTERSKKLFFICMTFYGATILLLIFTKGGVLRSFSHMKKVDEGLAKNGNYSNYAMNVLLCSSGKRNISGSNNRPFYRKRIITAYYRGWVHQGNIGDELLAEIINALMSQKLAERGFGFNMVSHPQSCTETWSHNRFDIYILGGGSLIEKEWLCHMKMAISRNALILIAGSGYDDYGLKLLNRGLYERFQQGDVQVLSERDPQTMSLLTALKISRRTFGGVRGPYTHSMVANATNASWFLPEIGDAGHLTAKLYGTDQKFDVFKTFAIPKREKYIVVNMADRSDSSYELKKGLMAEAMGQALIELLRTYHVILYPMASRDIVYVKLFTFKLRYLARRKSNVGGYDRKVVDCFLKLEDLPRIGSLVKSAFFTMNYLLHANYVSAAYETPFIVLIYRMKLFDLVGSMDLWDYSVDLRTITVGQILEKVQRLIQDREIIVKRLRAQNEKVSLKVEAVFERIAAAVTM